MLSIVFFFSFFHYCQIANAFLISLSFVYLVEPWSAEPLPPPIEPSTTEIPPVIDTFGYYCAFENTTFPLCQFEQDTSDNVGKWVQVSGANAPSSNHPTIDHTLHNSKYGHRLIILCSVAVGPRYCANIFTTCVSY